jgi:hypothetical protein
LVPTSSFTVIQRTCAVATSIGAPTTLLVTWIKLHADRPTPFGERGIHGS